MRAKAALAAALFLAASGASAQDHSSARKFVLGLYDAFRTSPAIEFGGQDAEKAFAPELAALIQKDDELSPEGEIGALDWDPICDCQDDFIKGVRVAISPTDRSDKLRAQVNFRNFGDNQSLVLDLLWLGDRWRVSDVHTQRTPSLVEFLSRAIADRNAPH